MSDKRAVLVIGAGDATDGAIDNRFIEDMFPERYALKDQGGVLDPDAIAENYWQIHCQPRTA